MLGETWVVTDRRDGLFVYYRLGDEQIERLPEDVLDSPGERAVPISCSCLCERGMKSFSPLPNQSRKGGLRKLV